MKNGVAQAKISLQDLEAAISKLYWDFGQWIGTIVEILLNFERIREMQVNSETPFLTNFFHPVSERICVCVCVCGVSWVFVCASSYQQAILGHPASVNSDTIYPEIASDHAGKGLSPNRTSSILDANCQSGLSPGCHLADWL